MWQFEGQNKDFWVVGALLLARVRYLYDHQSNSSRSKHSPVHGILHFQQAIFVYVCKCLSSDIQKGNFTSLILPTLYARYNLCRNRKWLMQMHFWEWKSIITVNRLVIKGLTTEKSRLELFFCETGDWRVCVKIECYLFFFKFYVLIFFYNKRSFEQEIVSNAMIQRSFKRTSQRSK